MGSALIELSKNVESIVREVGPIIRESAGVAKQGVESRVHAPINQSREPENGLCSSGEKKVLRTRKSPERSVKQKRVIKVLKSMAILSVYFREQG